ncbi:hypothetical protein [Streptococcus halichoeri]|uniref:hypothetical protein n=1 Tax=Streptococcus halichoeri TaxID=254785 RepID=UPI001359D0FB|nr:hypothetical protein [Streptococcus halichoeri]
MKSEKGLKQFKDKWQAFASTNWLQVTRVHVEVLSIIIIVACGLSVLTLKTKSHAALTYDKGKITYTGYVVNHRMNGQGKLVYANGDTYTGDFVNGTFDGQGTFQAKNGWYYKGEFSNGEPNGQGVLKAKNNEVYKGTFKQGIYQK